MKRKTYRLTGFTLVELLVVIGIIALLISVLLPALSKAREAGNLVHCQSALRQFGQFEHLYADFYKGYLIPCRYQKQNAEYGFYSPMFLGTLLNQGKRDYQSSGTQRTLSDYFVIKQVLTCVSADHSLDPTHENVTPNSKTVYFGDYIYNANIGTYKWDNAKVDTDPTGFVASGSTPWKKINQVPGNVILMMESMKPNVIPNGLGWFATQPDVYLDGSNVAYKSYFTKFNEIWKGSPTVNVATSLLVKQRIGTPHKRGGIKVMNALSADGGVHTINPYVDLFDDKTKQQTAREYLYYSRDDLGASPPVTSAPGWIKGAPGLP